MVAVTSPRRMVLRALGASATATFLSQPIVREAHSTQAGEWPQFGYELANTRHNPSASGPTQDVRAKWKFETGGDVYSSPAVTDGVVFVGGLDESVVALAANDGTKLWEYETEGIVLSSPAVVDGTVYIGSGDNHLYALNKTDGTELWRFQTGDQVQSSPAVTDSTVYIGSFDGYLYAISTKAGREQWRTEIGKEVYPSPAVANNTVYIASGIHVYALNATDGTVQWRFETGDGILSSPSVESSTVYIGSSDHNVYALSAADGTEYWHFETGDRVLSSPAVANSTVYIGSDDNHVYAIDAEDGTEYWRFKTEAPVLSSPAVANGTVYFGSTDHQVYALDAVDGTEQWRFEAENGVNSSPAVVNDAVYIGSLDTNLYALATDTRGGGASGTTSTVTETSSGTTSPATTTQTAFTGTTNVATSRVSDFFSEWAIGGSLFGVVAIFGGLYWIRRKSSEHEESEQSVTPQELIDSADEAVRTAGNARDDYDFDKALDAYEEAIDQYEAALNELSFDGNRYEEIETRLADTRQSHRETRERRDMVEGLENKLGDAEATFQKAVVDHALDETVSARVRYRQARNAFESILEQIEEEAAEEELLAAINPQPEPRNPYDRLPSNLANLRNLPTTVIDILRGLDIEETTDLTTAEKRTRERIRSHEEITEEMSSRLIALTWLDASDDTNDWSRERIETLHKRAETGYQVCL